VVQNLEDVETLSDRQREILRLIAEYHQAKEVARILNISERTVRTHTEEARRRLGVGTSREAARLIVAYDRARGIGHRDGGLATRIAEPVAAGPDLEHEHKLSSERKLSDHQFPGTGTGLAGHGFTGQDHADRRRSVEPSGSQQAGGAIKGGLYHDRGDGLADGGWERLKRWLKSRSDIEWLGLIIAVAFIAAVLLAATMSITIGALQAITSLARMMR